MRRAVIVGAALPLLLSALVFLSPQGQRLLLAVSEHVPIPTEVTVALSDRAVWIVVIGLLCLGGVLAGWWVATRRPRPSRSSED